MLARALLVLLLACLVVHPRANGRPMSGGSFGGRAGFRSASPSYSAPKFSAPRTYSAPPSPSRTYSTPRTSYSVSRPTRTVIVEHHHYSTGSSWIFWDRDDYAPSSGYTSGGGCSSTPAQAPAAARDAGRDRSVYEEDGGR